jgi:F0F1-type ATP synthase delta subunit
MNRVSRQQLAQAVASRISEGDAPKDIARSLAAYLITERRTKELEPLMRDVMRVRAEQGVSEVTAYSAFELSAAVKDQIRQMVTSGQNDKTAVILNKGINPELIGGVNIESAELQLDLTIRARLNRLKQLTTEGDR